MRYERIGVEVEISDRSSSAKMEEFVVIGSAGMRVAMKKEIG